MTPLDAERWQYLPQHPAGNTIERDLNDVIRLLAQAMREHDNRFGARGRR